MNGNNELTKEKSLKVYCPKCQHYYVTWDNRFPNGCKLYGIKSKQQPSIIVQQSIGMPCDKFTQK